MLYNVGNGLKTAKIIKKTILPTITSDRSNHCRDIATVMTFKMAATDILDFQTFKILMVLKMATVHHHAFLKFKFFNSCRS